MKQRLQYLFLAITLPVIFKLPQYRTHAHLAHESTESLQAKKDRITELQRLVGQYDNQSAWLNMFGVTGLISGREEEMMTKFAYPAILTQEALEKIEPEKDIIEVLLFYRQLQNNLNR